jgi:predicted tellurium resistance membrane protein TerC
VSTAIFLLRFTALKEDPMEWIFETQAWISLLTLTALEIVLGIDNIVFITILAGKLPHEQREKAKVIGLGLAMISRILLLFSLTWIMRLSAPLFTVFGNEISGRDLILIFGGLFLIGKSTFEIHEKLEGETEHAQATRAAASFAGILVQIMLLDVVFSLDSVITAVGLASQLSIMVLAVIISVIIMMFAVGKVSRFVDSHPTIKMLALSFLLLIGTTLVAEGVEVHFPKGYIYHGFFNFRGNA